MSTSPQSRKRQVESDNLLRIQTMGSFRVWRNGREIALSAWGREKALHLFQFFVTMSLQSARLHKEQIIDRLWPNLNLEDGNRDFKVALHAINKVLEPERKPRSEPLFIQRHDLNYSLNLEVAWIDALAFETLIAQGNDALPNDSEKAIDYYRQALALYQGDFLAERQYEDWSSAERERLQVLALGTISTLADLLVERNPLESIRLTQRVLAIDPVWENAYRIQMRAYLAQGNRPLAIRTYQQCRKTLDEELGIGPLPETVALYEQIKNIR